MKDLNKFMDDIDSRKEDIAKAISFALSDGDKVKAEREFPYIYETIKNCKHFIFNTTNGVNSNSYSKSIDFILDEIDKKVDWLSVKEYFYGRDKFVFKGDPLQANTDGLGHSFVYKLRGAYFFNKKMFLRLGIGYQAFINFALRKGEQSAFELAKLVRKLRVKSKMYKLKSFFSNNQDLADFKVSVENAFDVIDDFKIDSLDDLFELYTLVSSTFVSYDGLSEEEKKVIIANCKKLKRISKNPEMLESQTYVLKLKEKLEKVFHSLKFREMLENSNCEDFFKRYGFEVSSDNLLVLLKDYYYSHKVAGFRIIHKFDNKDVNIVYFNSSVFDDSTFWQNETIMHEFIHSLEPISKERKDALFVVKCRYLNEALTEFLAIESLNYLNGNIVEDNWNFAVGESESAYFCLLPMVEVLKKSTLWEDILYCKKVNDYSLLEEVLGKDAMRISNLFNSTYIKRNVDFFDRNLPENEEIAELTKIIQNIEKNNPRYNKSISI